MSNTHTDVLLVRHLSGKFLMLMLTAQAGAFAAFTVDLLVYPLDTLKTRQVLLYECHELALIGT